MLYRWVEDTLQETDGYTLVETVVAMALLVAVLVPTGTLLGHLMLKHQAARQADALRLAEVTLERMIAQHDPQNAVQEVREEKLGPWRIVRSRRRSGGLVELHVVVYRKERETPTVKLQTARKQ